MLAAPAAVPVLEPLPLAVDELTRVEVSISVSVLPEVLLVAALVVAAPDAEADPVPVKVGGGTIADASSSAPTPQGIAAPPGWVLFAGVVVVPSAAARVQRVVHVVLGDPGAVNW